MKGLICLLVLLVGCTDHGTLPDPQLGYLPSVEPPVQIHEDEINLLIEKHNSIRSRQNLPVLREHPQLTQHAERHAQWMARSRILRHSSIRSLLGAFGVVSENIAQGHTHEAQVMNDWMNSRGHRANILDRRHRFIGVGRSNNYWCVVFGG